MADGSDRGRVGPERPDWERDGAGWPNREASDFVEAAGVRWHVQRLGSGPSLLLLHGSGGAGHSWAELLPRLAERFDVVAPDLPGHGFTATPDPARLALPAIAADAAALLRALGAAPRLVLAHSAGAAVAARMALDGAIAPAALVAIGPALGPEAAPIPAPLRALLAPLATSAFTARFAAALARRTGVVDRLLDSTGSAVPERYRRHYRTLISRPGHVRAVMTLMSRWDARALDADLPRLRVPALLVAGSRDRWIDPAGVRRAAARIPRGEFRLVPDAGHLLHEERPALVEALVLEAAARAGLG